MLASISGTSAIAQPDRRRRRRPGQHGRDPSGHRGRALHLRHHRAVRRHRLRPGADRPVRDRRDAAISRRSSDVVLRADPLRGGPAAESRGLPPLPRHHPALLRDRHLHRHPAGRGRPRWRRSWATTRPSAGPRTRTSSARARSRASPGPRRPTTPATGGAMVPTLALGIPGSGTTAIILAALMMHGLRPGPFLLRETPEFMYAIFTAMLLANFVFLAIGAARRQAVRDDHADPADLPVAVGVRALHGRRLRLPADRCSTSGSC